MELRGERSKDELKHDASSVSQGSSVGKRMNTETAGGRLQQRKRERKRASG